MDGIYANVDLAKPVCEISATKPSGLSSSKKKVYVGVIVSLGLLAVFLLAGIIIIGLYYSDLSEKTADLTVIKNNLTERVQTSNDKLSSMAEERTMLNTRLQHLCRTRACPAEWRLFGCSCYLLSTQSGSWDEGREDCRKRGADLIVIDDADEQTFLSTLTNKYAWIGLNDNETEGSWTWVDGTPLTVTYWATNQPDNGAGIYGEEDCAHINPYESWNDVSCAASRLWVCEK